MKNDKNLELEKISSKDYEAKKAMDNWLNGVFGLQPHKVNYILPYGYREDAYISHDANIYTNVEAELQVSLKMNLGKNLFGLNEKYYVAYTHKAFWQIYIESSPFRETNYTPEAFVVVPVADMTSIFQLRSLKFAIAHTSNGLGETHDEALYTYHYEDPQNRSRSLNYLYSEATFQHDTLITELRVYVRLPESKNSDDNPDYVDFYGCTSLKFSYFVQKHMITAMARGNFATGKGAFETTYSYPILNDTYLYAKFFAGYGESLIDYNDYITKFSIGFSFSR